MERRRRWADVAGWGREAERIRFEIRAASPQCWRPGRAAPVRSSALLRLGAAVGEEPAGLGLLLRMLGWGGELPVLLGPEEGARRQICGFCVDLFAITAFFPFNFLRFSWEGELATRSCYRAGGSRAGGADRSPFSRPCRRTKSRPGPGGASAWKRAAPGAVGEGRRGRSAAPAAGRRPPPPGGALAPRRPRNPFVRRRPCWRPALRPSDRDGGAGTAARPRAALPRPICGGLPYFSRALALILKSIIFLLGNIFPIVFQIRLKVESSEFSCSVALLAVWI